MMQMFKALEHDNVARVGWGVQVLLASPAGLDGTIARQLARLGNHVTVEAQMYDALAQLVDDPRAAQMLVIDCDAYGGLDAGRRGFAILGGPSLRVPVILISASCVEQTFSQGSFAPTILRAPVTAVALRVAFDAAFGARRVIGRS